MKLADALRGVAALGFDTPPIIYFVEQHPRYDPLVTEVFRGIEDGHLMGVTSAIALVEVLVHPYRHGDTDLAEQYRDLLLDSENFDVWSVGPSLAEDAAGLRAQYNLRTPDALQVAAALSAGCEAILTNDPHLKRVTEIDVLVLNELEL